MPEARLLSVAEVLATLGISKTNLYKNIIRTGRLQPVRIGRAVRFRSRDVEALIAGVGPEAGR
ncbi:helix-turn-helix transcriptional regulator [Prosthecomicrobium hirschii]|uniref:helix-turn-helix transcriptional regulator n=1 Tax=Prosthecodimorpha hirschii TaxID=665126 RepID=UPI0009FA39B6|nr:helix-turn-helix domain-containing protein [Prosthecomicrobium hirschii]